MDYSVEYTLYCGRIVGLMNFGIRKTRQLNHRLVFSPSDLGDIVEEAKQLVKGYIMGAKCLPNPQDNCVRAVLNRITGEDGREVPFEENLEVIVTREQIIASRLSN